MSSRRRQKKSRKEKEESSSSSSEDGDQARYTADFDAFMHSIGRKGTSHRDPKKMGEKEKPKDKEEKPREKTRAPPQAGNLPLPLSTVHVSSGKRTSLLGAPDPSSAAK